MLNLALVGLLAGTLATGGGDSKNPQAGDKPAPAPAVPGIFTTTSVDAPTPRTIQDTYAFGMAASGTPLRFWAEYGQGEAESIWNTDGETEEIQIAFTDGDITTRRVGIGAELGLPVGLFGFGIAAGAELSLAQNQFNVGEEQGANPAPVPAGGFITDDLESDFGLQNVKLYGIARAGAIGLHGGYVFDLGSEREFGEPQTALGGLSLPTSLSNSDGRDAIFFGADFDYPSRVVRLFGGVDYYKLQAGGQDNPNTAFDETDTSGDDILNAMFGAGLRFSVFELGAALQIQTRYSQPVVGDIGTTTGIGGSAATIAPYLRISPPQIPASLFVKGAVQEEYTEFGYRLGGSNSPKPSIGFTAGLTFGFQ